MSGRQDKRPYYPQKRVLTGPLSQRDVTPFHDVAVVMNLRQTNSLCISLFKAELHTFSPFKATAVCSINICYLVVQVTVKMIMIGAAVIF